MCDKGFDTSEEIKQHMVEDHKKIPSLKANSGDKGKGEEDNTEDLCEYKDENSEEENIKKIICKLCYEGNDGNTEVKEHFIKEHLNNMNVSNTIKYCGYGFCMDIKQDQCAQFCLFYKNMTVLEGEIQYYKEKGGSES